MPDVRVPSDAPTLTAPCECMERRRLGRVPSAYGWPAGPSNCTTPSMVWLVLGRHMPAHTCIVTFSRRSLVPAGWPVSATQCSPKRNCSGSVLAWIRPSRTPAEGGGWEQRNNVLDTQCLLCMLDAILTSPAVPSAVVIATMPTDKFTRKLNEFARPRNSSSTCKWRWPQPAAGKYSSIRHVIRNNNCVYCYRLLWEG